jgi:hypothetical protein
MTINHDIIEKLYNDSKNKLKDEYEDCIAKIKEDLNKTRQQALYKIKKI